MARGRAEAGGVPAASGHMTRKMWDFIIPVLDCSQLLKLCPSQCKPAACPTVTPGLCTDGPPRTMAGKTRRSFANTRNRSTATGTRPFRNQDRGEGGERLSIAHCRQRTKTSAKFMNRCEAVTRAAARILSEMRQWDLMLVELSSMMHLLQRFGPERSRQCSERAYPATFSKVKVFI